MGKADNSRNIHIIIIINSDPDMIFTSLIFVRLKPRDVRVIEIEILCRKAVVSLCADIIMLRTIVRG